MENTENEMGRILVASRMMTPDGTMLESRHVHDYVSHTDKNGEVYMLDGGTEYRRTTINKVPARDMSLYLDSPFEEIREAVTRGTFDSEGHRIWKKVSEMSDEHLRNCVTYNIDHGHAVDCVSNLIYMRELYYRKVNGISIPDDHITDEENEEDEI